MVENINHRTGYIHTYCRLANARTAFSYPSRNHPQPLLPRTHVVWYDCHISRICLVLAPPPGPH